eukprot:jgi/Mesen1/10216/ME000770S09643
MNSKSAPKVTRAAGGERSRQLAALEEEVPPTRSLLWPQRGGCRRSHWQRLRERLGRMLGEWLGAAGSVTVLVGKFRPISHACWQAGEATPYLHLACAFKVVERENGHLKINDMSMGGSTVAAAICETTGVQRRRLHELYTSLGDLGTSIPLKPS